MTIHDRVERLDLRSVGFALMHKHGWSPDRTRIVARAYRAFLSNIDVHSEPSNEVDLFWHEHILDTQKYAEDCKAVYGSFLHHVPQSGRCRKAVAA